MRDILMAYQGGLIKVFYQFHYQTIFIDELTVSSMENTLYMYWNFTWNSDRYTATFQNVSRVNIQDWSYPLQISELDIIDNTKKGWDSSSNFLIKDCDEQKLSFYCERINVAIEN